MVVVVEVSISIGIRAGVCFVLVMSVVVGARSCWFLKLVIVLADRRREDLDVEYLGSVR